MLCIVHPERKKLRWEHLTICFLVATATGNDSSTYEDSIDQGEAYRIICDGKVAGGVVIHIEKDRGFLDLLFTLPDDHSKGIGYGAWCEIEKLHPEVRVWETLTPYFETINIHFYVNKCGFHIVEFYNPFHKGHDEHMDPSEEYCGGTGMDFRFEKVVRK